VARNPDVRTPSSYARPGEWPDGPLSGAGLAEHARQLVLNVRTAMGERSIRDVASSAGLTPTTLSALLSGERWPDTLTLAKLEEALGVDLWPRLASVRRGGGPARPNPQTR
jgi:transcriptional regulator with XRE-family HTH domain